MSNYFMETHHHEWLLTNKKGGYALGTGNLINQRKYHGLLIAGYTPDKRTHLVAGIEEKLEWRGESIHLDSNNYNNCIFPEGFLYLVKSWIRPYPIFLYSALPHQNEILIKKELFISEHTNSTVIKYTNLGHHKLHLELHPKYTMHEYHELNNSGILDNEVFTNSITTLTDYCEFDTQRAANNIRIYGYAQNAEVIEKKYIYKDVFYPWDVMKGYPGICDQISLFEIQLDMQPGESRFIIFTDYRMNDVNQEICNIIDRYIRLPLPIDYPSYNKDENDLLNKIDYDDNVMFNDDEYLKILEFALSDFLVENDVMAGYPWYGVVSSDTMYYLGALLLNPKNIHIVEKIISKYVQNLTDGFLPVNPHKLISESNPISLEATLRLALLVNQLVRLDPECILAKSSTHVIGEIIKAIINNNEYPFRVREDGLIDFHSAYAAMTWMNSIVDSSPAAPRKGSPIEINALWYNVLFVYCNIKETKKTKFGKEVSVYRDKTELSFQNYFSTGFAADRIDGSDNILETRPNALIAAALPDTPISVEQMKRIYQTVLSELYTSYGIRSLNPKDPKFKKKYYGYQKDRNSAMHNGSVWAWLFGPLCDLYVKIYSGDESTEDTKKHILDLFGNIRNSFIKGHIASVAEIWDGDSPHFPKGSPAYAKSVATLYLIEMALMALERNIK